MPRTLIGNDSSGSGCIKIMKDLADNPYSTADSLRYKFLYNSKNNVQANLVDIQVVNVLFATGAGWIFYPAGSNSSTFTSMGSGYAAGTIWAYKNEYFPSLRYSVPLFDIKFKMAGGVVYNQQMTQWQDKFDYYNGQGGSYKTGNGELFGWATGVNMSAFGGATMPNGGIFANITGNDGQTAFNKFLSRDKRIVTWNLPGNNVAVGSPSLPPNGSKTLVIKSDQFKIAKPGYNVDTATGAQVAFDASNIPVKVLRSGDIALPAGVSYYETGVTLPDTVALDVHFYDGATITYPNNPKSVDFGATYWFDGSRIGFNATASMRARFMLYMEDNTPPANGSNKVFRQFNDGTQDVVQFLRPGSSDPPTWADIIVDSRYPAVQILAEGYFTVPVGNGALTDIPFDGNGMFPMVKYVTEHGAGNGASVGHNNVPISWTGMFRLPFLKVLKYVAPGGQSHAGESSYCQLTANNARFVTFRGNVGDYYNRQDSPGTWATSGAYAPIGIRYYIFGIPQ